MLSVWCIHAGLWASLVRYGPDGALTYMRKKDLVNYSKPGRAYNDPDWSREWDQDVETQAPAHLQEGRRKYGCVSEAYPVFHVISHSLFEPMSYRTSVK